MKRDTPNVSSWLEEELHQHCRLDRSKVDESRKHVFESDGAPAGKAPPAVHDTPTAHAGPEQRVMEPKWNDLRSPVVLLAALTASCLWSAQLRAEDFTFAKLVQGDPAITSRVATDGYAINDAGSVAFVQSIPSINGMGVFMKSGETVSKLVDTSGEYKSFHVTSINNSGVVLIVATLKTGDHVLCAASAAGVTVIAKGVPPVVYSGPSINDSGDIVYESTDRKVMLWSSGNSQEIIDTNRPLFGLGHVNSSGVVPYSANNTSLLGVYVAYPNRTVTIAEAQGMLVGPIAPSINDGGEVAFSALKPNLTFAVYKGSGGATTEVVPPALAPNVFANNPVAINNAGTVAFYTGSSTLQQFMLVAGSGSTASKVVGNGDLVFGETIYPVVPTRQFGRILNNRGQIVFPYVTGSGECGLAVASPVSGNGGSGSESGALLISNAASYSTILPVAQNSIVTARGAGLATGTAVAGQPLPVVLAGTTLTVTDSQGTLRPAPLLFASPTQVNFLVPAGTTTGPAKLKLTTGDNKEVEGKVDITSVSPGVFYLNAGFLTAANVLRLHDGNQLYEPVFQVSAGQTLPALIDMGPASDQLYLTLYCTGLRQASRINVVIDSPFDGGFRADVPITFAGASPEFPGLDQVNLGPLPRTLAGKNLVVLNLTADGLPANKTTLVFR